MTAARQTTPKPSPAAAPPALVASAGCGSAIVELVFAMAGLPLTTRDVAWDDLGRDAALGDANALRQVPVLTLADGTVMTEVAAIVLHVADGAPGAGIAPPPGDPARPRFLRWLAFLTGSIYPTFHHGDVYAAAGDAVAQQIGDALARRREERWALVEAAATGPWFLGASRSAVDAAIAVMARWSPGLAWFDAHAPKLATIARALPRDAALAPIVARNFGE